MIKTITPLYINKGNEAFWGDRFPPRKGWFVELKKVEVNTLQAIKSEKYTFTYISKVIENTINTKIFWVIPSTDIEYDFEWNTIELYKTTFSNNDVIHTREPIIEETL